MCVCVCVRKRACSGLRVSLYVCMPVFCDLKLCVVYVLIHSTYGGVCESACVPVCMCACVCARARACVCLCARARARARVFLNVTQLLFFKSFETLYTFLEIKTRQHTHRAFPHRKVLHKILKFDLFTLFCWLLLLLLKYHHYYIFVSS